MHGDFAAREGAEDLDLGGSITIIATRKVVQMTDDGWDAVVTSGGKGTFLIRRGKGHLSTQCPLLCYEIRRIDAGSHDDQHDRPKYGQEFGGRSGGDEVARQPAGIAVSACAFHSPPRGCDRDERGTP